MTKRKIREIGIAVLMLTITFCMIQKVSATTVTEAKPYNITFDANGGTVNTESKSVTMGSAYGTLPTPTRTNYIFKGWYTFASGGAKVAAANIVRKAKEHTLYAHWLGKQYTIKLNPNGGQITNSSVTVYFGSKYVNQLAKPTRVNFDFDGWYTAAKGGEKITETTVYDEKSKKTLYAHWTAKTLTISFITFTGEEFDRVVTCGKKIGTLPAPKRDNYTFAGWFTWDNYADKDAEAVKTTDIISETSDLKLFARWYPKE